MARTYKVTFIDESANPESIEADEITIGDAFTLFKSTILVKAIRTGDIRRIDLESAKVTG